MHVDRQLEAYKDYNITKSNMLYLIERLPWETNQYLAEDMNLPLETIRKIRTEVVRKHNRHDVDDEELGTQEWE